MARALWIRQFPSSLLTRLASFHEGLRSMRSLFIRPELPSTKSFFLLYLVVIFIMATIPILFYFARLWITWVQCLPSHLVILLRYQKICTKTETRMPAFYQVSKFPCYFFYSTVIIYDRWLSHGIDILILNHLPIASFHFLFLFWVLYQLSYFEFKISNFDLIYLRS